jgi:hypothetical protein
MMVDPVDDLVTNLPNPLNLLPNKYWTLAQLRFINVAQNDIV